MHAIATSSFSRSLSSLFSLRKVFCSGSETIPRTCLHQSQSCPHHPDSHHQEYKHPHFQNSPPSHHQDHLWLAPLPASWLKSRRSRLPLAAPQSKPDHDDADEDDEDDDEEEAEYHLSILLFFSSALSSSPPPKLIVKATGESLSSSWIVIIIMRWS